MDRKQGAYPRVTIPGSNGAPFSQRVALFTDWLLGMQHEDSFQSTVFLHRPI